MINGFKFVVVEGGTQREVMLHGRGGLFGNGVLYSLKDSSVGDALVTKTQARLLGMARVELESRGDLLEFLGDDLPSSERIRAICPESVVDCFAYESWGDAESMTPAK